MALRRVIAGAWLAFSFGFLSSLPVSAESAEAWASKVDKRLSHMRPKPEEHKFDLIGWAPSLHEAVAAAKSSKRLLFVFTNDGFVNIGRC